MSRLQQIVGEFHSAAAREPHNASRILDRGAKYLRRIAMDPKNAASQRAILAAAAGMETARAQHPSPNVPGTLVDDMDELMERRIMADLLSSGLPAADLEANAIEQAMSEGSVTPSGDANENMIRVPTQAVPPAALRGVLGRSFVCKHGEGEKPVIFYRGENRDTQIVTIDLGRQETGGTATFPEATDGTDPYFYGPYAAITYGTDGWATERVEVDIGRGTRIAIPASNVNVSVGMDAPPSGYVAGSMVLGGSLGLFGGTSTAPVTRTRYLNSLAKDSFDTVKIPARAQVLLPPQASDLAGTTRLRVLDASGATLYALQYANGTCGTIPLSNDAHSVYIYNVGPNSSNYRLAFQIAF